MVSVAFQVGPAEKVPEDSVQLEEKELILWMADTWSFSARPQPWQGLSARHWEEKGSRGRGRGALAAQDQFEASTSLCHAKGRDDTDSTPTVVVVVALQHPSLPSDCAQTPSTCQRRAAQLGLGSTKARGQLDDKS